MWRVNGIDKYEDYCGTDRSLYGADRRIDSNGCRLGGWRPYSTRKRYTTLVRPEDQREGVGHKPRVQVEVGQVCGILL
ncbi:hypothetical protein KIPB_014387 [Kipferlia bialata]|uniref:Uncharacterized protein n=1 Tax=Kipferlia bialata TaxID=797122 RepID=A0A9K3GPI3_9EUKA|nr:hypothetical protein KIPB_014387 [Kipferlia bialata]|eukprot:g14387.t1